jgi:hypothetical protein
MGKQTGVTSLIGTMEGLTYYKTAESGLLVRKKSSLNKERVTKDPAFAKSREANKEFGRTISGCHLIRNTMALAGKEFSETRMYNRLTRLLRALIVTDTTKPSGERSLQNSDLTEMMNFQWNVNQAFRKIYQGDVKFSIDTKTGLMEVDIDGINAPRDLMKVKSASHVQLVMECGAFDFDLNKGIAVSDTTDWLSLKKKHPVQTLSGKLTIKPGMRVLLGVGIRFGQEVNDAIYELRDQTSRGFVVGAVE